VQPDVDGLLHSRVNELFHSAVITSDLSVWNNRVSSGSFMLMQWFGPSGVHTLYCQGHLPLISTDVLLLLLEHAQFIC
jgi:hypothetical protein